MNEKKIVVISLKSICLPEILTKQKKNIDRFEVLIKKIRIKIYN